VLGPDGEVAAIVHRVEDVTEIVRLRSEGAAQDQLVRDQQALIGRLRESEERYRILFESIDEGFCTVEVLFNARDEPVDYRFLETNRAFAQQTGLEGAAGKTMRQLVPSHERYWFELYGRVARTGEPVRFEERAEAWAAGLTATATASAGRRAERSASYSRTLPSAKRWKRGWSTRPSTTR
jgi:PAS domain S-box-containing protein